MKLPEHELLSFAETLADAARPIAMRHFRQPVTVEIKADNSPVTIADKSIELEMRRLITEKFPEHGVFGEEFGQQFGAEHTWVLDPIDGTKSFITGMPLFGTLIALAHHREPVLGLIDFPALNERWMSIAGDATLHNGQAVRTSGCKKISDARCYCTSTDMFKIEEDRLRFEALSKRTALRRFGGDCYIYALLASGHCDLVIEASLQPYDYFSLVPIIEGAGGKITDWQGKALDFNSDGRVIAAASEALWQEALEGLCR